MIPSAWLYSFTVLFVISLLLGFLRGAMAQISTAIRFWEHLYPSIDFSFLAFTARLGPGLPPWITVICCIFFGIMLSCKPSASRTRRHNFGTEDESSE